MSIKTIQLQSRKVVILASQYAGLNKHETFFFKLHKELLCQFRMLLLQNYLMIWSIQGEDVPRTVLPQHVKEIICLSNHKAETKLIKHFVRKHK